MSKSKTKTSNTSTATNNSTTTPTVAPWLSQGYQDLGGLIGKYATTNPSDYVVGANDTQKQAFTNAQGLGGWSSMLDKATGLASGAATGSATPATAATASGYVDSYMNPYLKQVVDATLADYDVNSGKTRAAQAAQGAKNQAFGGSRYAIREAQTEGELARGRATTEAQLRAQAYEQALAAAQADADRAQQTNLFNTNLSDQALNRQLSAAGVLGNFANSSATNSQNDVNTQLTAGNTQYGIDQKQATMLPDWLKSISDLYGSIPIGSFTSLDQTGSSTGNSQGTSSTSSLGLSDIQKAAQMAAMFSDIRLKENIEYSDTDARGRNWYTYNYIWENASKRRRGVMAQEVIKTDPQSVITTDDGFLMVNYGTLR